MLLGLDLNHLLTFPLKDAQDRKRFAIGALLLLASGIIPILFCLPVLGYSMKIMRRVVAGQQPSLPDWETPDCRGLSRRGVETIRSGSNRTGIKKCKTNTCS